jgi:hypothetical protein
MQQSPQLAVAAQYDISSLTTVSAIRTAMRVSLGAVKVCTSLPSLSGTEKDLNIIYEI